MPTKPPSRSLTDQYGEWCAVCLDYFSRENPAEYHHVLTKEWIKTKFTDLDFSWVIPVHRRCHRGPSGIQPFTDFATHYFFKKLERENRLDERSKLSRQLHERGYYWLSVLANLDAIKGRIDGIDEEQLLRRCEFALSSVAGVRGGQNLPNILLAQRVGRQSPRIRMNLANLQAARGHRRKAAKTLEIVTELMGKLSKREKEGLRPALLRRQAQLTRVTTRARDAVKIAENNYSRDTALVIQGVLAVSGGQFRFAEESIEELGKRGDSKSWLYQAEERFIRALLWILTGEKCYDAIYSSLCEAQYIFVILGLQMSTSPDLVFPRPPYSSWDWTPSDVLRTFFKDKRMPLGRVDCHKIRRLTIGNTELLDRLLYGMLAPPSSERAGADAGAGAGIDF